MKFDKIHADTNCNCIEGASLDLERIYARKINKPCVVENDFKSHWEKGTRTDNDCRQICGFKGISMNIWNHESKKPTIDKYLTTFRITPRSKNSIFLFRFKSNAGVLRCTPSKDNRYHYDFFKSDDFSIDMLEEIGVFELRELL